MNDQPSIQTANPPLEISAEVRSFLESLLQDAGMKSLDEQMHEQMLIELYARLDNFINSAIVDNMQPQYLEEFIKINEEKKSKEESEQFLKDHLPNAEEVMAQAFLDFRDLYLGNVAVARNIPSDNNAAQVTDTKNVQDQQVTQNVISSNDTPS